MLATYVRALSKIHYRSIASIRKCRELALFNNREVRKEKKETICLRLIRSLRTIGPEFPSSFDGSERKKERIECAMKRRVLLCCLELNMESEYKRSKSISAALEHLRRPISERDLVNFIASRIGDGN